MPMIIRPNQTSFLLMQIHMQLITYYALSMIILFYYYMIPLASISQPFTPNPASLGIYLANGSFVKGSGGNPLLPSDNLIGGICVRNQAYVYLNQTYYVGVNLIGGTDNKDAIETEYRIIAYLHACVIPLISILIGLVVVKIREEEGLNFYLRGMMTLSAFTILGCLLIRLIMLAGTIGALTYGGVAYDLSGSVCFGHGSNQTSIICHTGLEIKSESDLAYFLTGPNRLERLFYSFDECTVRSARTGHSTFSLVMPFLIAFFATCTHVYVYYKGSGGYVEVE